MTNCDICGRATPGKQHKTCSVHTSYRFICFQCRFTGKVPASPMMRRYSEKVKRLKAALSRL